MFSSRGRKHRNCFFLWSPGERELYLQEEEIPPLGKEDLRSNLYLIREILRSGDEGAKLFILKRLPVSGRGGFASIE